MPNNGEGKTFMATPLHSLQRRVNNYGNTPVIIRDNGKLLWQHYCNNRDKKSTNMATPQLWSQRLKVNNYGNTATIIGAIRQK